MLRMLVVALSALSLALVAHGAESKSKTEPKPKWQRLLTGADARKATDVAQRIEKLEAADRYAEAIRLHEELLVLRTRVQGADHWETVNEKWNLATAKKVAALPKQKRDGWQRAYEGAMAAVPLQQKAQYRKALTLLQERLKWCKEILGEDHPDTALSYNNVAMNLNVQGRYAEAASLFQKALHICRKILGEEHPFTATTYNNIGYNLESYLGNTRKRWILWIQLPALTREHG